MNLNLKSNNNCWKMFQNYIYIYIYIGKERVFPTFIYYSDNISLLIKKIIMNINILGYEIKELKKMDMSLLQ